MRGAGHEVKAAVTQLLVGPGYREQQLYCRVQPFPLEETQLDRCDRREVGRRNQVGDRDAQRHMVSSYGTRDDAKSFMTPNVRVDRPPRSEATRVLARLAGGRSGRTRGWAALTPEVTRLSAMRFSLHEQTANDVPIEREPRPR